MNTITDLLNLEDPNVYISNTLIEGTKKYITLESHPYACYCPLCNYRMHSRGIKTRRINHPILQDGYELIIILKQRRWRCTNQLCLHEENENFNFVKKSKRQSNATDYLIINAFRDLSKSATAIANAFNTSDTYVINTFDNYVEMDRLELTDIISIDEVYIDMDDNCKYALVIQDFYTGDTIDILRSRRKELTEPYFVSIPIEERLRVKYLISDMYNPYIKYIDSYFPNAVSVVDSFHVIQWINRELDNYLRKLLKHYKKRDEERAIQKTAELHMPVTPRMSNEVYLLQKYRWILLMNRSKIEYHDELRMDHHFHYLMNTYDYEYAFFKLDPNLEEYRELKELYIQFNDKTFDDLFMVEEELDELIDTYLHSGHDIFVRFGLLLSKFSKSIINSFALIPDESGEIRRLSNGPIESLNRKVKDLKRLGRGFRNFSHFRNRFLFASRNNPVINGSSDASTSQYFE